mgnify:FL=1
MDNHIAEIAITIMIGIIGFFLVRFFYVVDEIRKDVKALLIKGAAWNEALMNVKKELGIIEDKLIDVEHRMSELEKSKSKAR